jgi:Tfp pilus assembly protein PilF
MRKHRWACLAMLAFLLPFSAVYAKEIPMWEGLAKTETQRSADAAFVEAARNATGGKLEEATDRAIQLGWQFIQQGEADMAIKRFNQAWLLDPNHPDVYWGFAVATALQGAPLPVVEKHFSKAESLKKNNAALFADHGRILQERGENKNAITYFTKALAIDPSNRDAHVGMMLASIGLGDTVTAEKHRKLVR